jgi:HEAT repeat protein
MKKPFITFFACCFLLIVLGCARTEEAHMETLKRRMQKFNVKEKVLFLLESYRDADTVLERKSIIRLIAEDDRQLINGLIAVMKDNYPELRSRAAVILAMVGEPAVQGLIELIKEGNEVCQRDALTTLVLIGKPAVPGVIPLLEEKDQKKQLLAIAVLSMIGDKRCAASLLDTFRDLSKDEIVRKRALSALVTIGEPAVATLETALSEENDKYIHRLIELTLQEIKESTPAEKVSISE